MSLLFHPRIVNGPFGDPGLFVSFLFDKRAILFDLGDIYSLSSRDILKISHVFVSHTHMDHFSGFDRLLRLFLGRNKDICLYGPEGFLNNIEGKLKGYSWNLVQNYKYSLILHATEVHSDQKLSRTFRCINKFAPDHEIIITGFNGILHEEPAFKVSALILDHGIPCMGFSIKEQFHVNIIKENVESLGLEIGPWLRNLKDALLKQQKPDSEFEICSVENKVVKKKFILGELSEKIALITQGQKITYIGDAAFNKSNIDKITEFAKDSDHLYIEAGFLHKDCALAEKKLHLTAKQAGYLAAMAKAKLFDIFHFSPRNIGLESLLYHEARQEYEKHMSGIANKLTS